MSRAKYWCFTLNNYDELELDLIKRLVERGEATYVICGIEEGKSGTPHVQGYLELGERKRIGSLKRLGGLRRAHFESRRGTQAQAIEYCKKDGSFEEFGTPFAGKQGKRTDLESAIDAIKDGISVRGLWEEHTSVMVRYEKGMLNARRALRPKKQKKTFDLDSYEWHPLDIEEGKSYVLWGASGIGKTSYIRSRFPKFLWVCHMDDLSIFDEEEHEGIVFDDMSFRHMPRTGQIHIVDCDDDRSIHIRYKTAFIPAGTTKIFTSNVPDIFDLSDRAIARRVTTIELCGEEK
jgi:hypothetical protein